MTSLGCGQKHATQMILKLYSHVSDSRQKVPEGFVLVPRPLVLRVSLGSRFLGGGVTCGVLGLSSVNSEVLLQLLGIDIVQFTLAAKKKKNKINKNLNLKQRKNDN